MREGKLKEYAKLARIEYSGFSCVVVIGALTVTGPGLSLSLALPLFFLNVLTLVWGFVHNDYCDRDIDRAAEELSDRPLVKGTVSPRAALRLIIVCVLLNLAVPLFFARTLCLAIILVGSIVLEALYNLLSKKFPGADFFYAGSAALLVLFGAVVAAGAQGLAGLGPLTWTILALQFIDHFFFNAVEGGLKDAVNDQKSGARTLASRALKKTGDKLTVSVFFKLVFIILKVATITLVFLPFVVLDLPCRPWQLVTLIILALASLGFTVKLLNIDPSARQKIATYAVRQEIASKFLVVFMLIGYIGIPWAAFLLLVPPAWFFVFNYILHGKPFSLPKGF